MASIRYLLLAIIATFTLLPATANASTTSQRTVVALINEARGAHGLAALAATTPLSRAAAQHSRDMGRRSYFSHTTLSAGTDFVGRILRHEQRGKSHWYGETIGWGSGDLGTPAGIVRAWLNSPPHRRVLLDRHLRRVGIGAWHGTFQGAPQATVYTADFSG